MNGLGRGIAAAVALGVLAVSAVAGTVALDGPLVQGGLVIGTTEPDARVSVDGRPVRVSPEGTFLIGFGRDAGPEARLRIEHPDGTRTERSLTVAKREYPVQRIDGLPARQVTPGPEELKRIRDDNRRIAAVRARDRDRADFGSGFAWPATGPVSGVFGSRRILNGAPKNPHNGVDIAALPGAPVAAAADGVVALVQPDMFYTGKTVMVDHGHGLTSIYVHLDSIDVAAGQRVAKGDRIGTVGMTGRVTGPHLHWGVNLLGVHLDPALLAGPMDAGPAAATR